VEADVDGREKVKAQKTTGLRWYMNIERGQKKRIELEMTFLSPILSTYISIVRGQRVRRAASNGSIGHGYRSQCT
jgi:hypothetical protein